jgi:hypothetical protein
VDLYLPRHFAPQNEASYLDLVISYASGQTGRPPILNLALNDVPLAVIALSQENVESVTHSLYFESASLISGQNRLNISLDTGTACDDNTMTSVIVYDSSSFHVAYLLTQLTPDLALYPNPFFERSFEVEPVYIVLPANPSTTDLSAAATIAAGLGKFSNDASSNSVHLISVLDTQISAQVRDSHHLIVVGKRGANQLLDQLNLPMALDDPALSNGQGVIQELVSPWNPLRMVLVVTGNSDEGLINASQALNREAHLLSMQGSTAIVQDMFLPESVTSRSLEIDKTMADLGYGGKVVYGTRPHTLTYGFDMPVGWTIVGEAQFTLYFGHARVISPTASSLDVYLNNVPLDSVSLDEGNASEGVLEVALPAWVIRSGRNELYISVEMNLGSEDKCLFWDSQQLWTAIYDHSYVHLPVISRDVEPSLNLLPYPFDKRPNLSGLLMVLADRPRPLDYDLMLKLAVGLGAVDQGDSLALDVTTADLVTQENRQDEDLFLIGRPSLHSLIAELNNSLPQPFEPGSDQLRPSSESVAFVDNVSRDIGLIEELTAPWNAERTILAITGTTDEGLVLAATAFLSQSDALAGNVVLVEEPVGIRTFDTRSLLAMPGNSTGAADPSQVLLIQLGERWW